MEKRWINFFIFIVVVLALVLLIFASMSQEVFLDRGDSLDPSDPSLPFLVEDYSLEELGEILSEANENPSDSFSQPEGFSVSSTGSEYLAPPVQQQANENQDPLHTDPNHPMRCTAGYTIICSEDDGGGNSGGVQRPPAIPGFIIPDNKPLSGKAQHDNCQIYLNKGSIDKMCMESGKPSLCGQTLSPQQLNEKILEKRMNRRTSHPVICTAWHEAKHALQQHDAPRCDPNRKCKNENEAYKEEKKCYEELKKRHCTNPPPTHQAYCNSIDNRLGRLDKLIAHTQCLCDLPPLPPDAIDECDQCLEGSGFSLNDPEARGLCSEYPDAYYEYMGRARPEFGLMECSDN